MFVTYPKSSSLFQRDILNPAFEQLVINLVPNTILYIDPSLNLAAISGSHFSFTSSMADTASFALNAGGGGGGAITWANWKTAVWSGLH